MLDVRRRAGTEVMPPGAGGGVNQLTVGARSLVETLPLIPPPSAADELIVGEMPASPQASGRDAAMAAAPDAAVAEVRPM